MTLAIEKSSTEQPPVLETVSVGAGTELHLGQLSLQHEAARQQGIVRGDRLGEEGQDRGFRIEHLEGERSHEPVPVGEVLPDMAERFAQEYVDGEIQAEAVKDAWTGMRRGLPGFITFFPVDASKYNAAVAEGKAPAGLFDKDGKVSHIEPGAEALEVWLIRQKSVMRLRRTITNGKLLPLRPSMLTTLRASPTSVEEMLGTS